MFECLTLSNFQCWKKLVIDFAAGATSIQGPTDRGKTTILRALRFLCLNKPPKDGPLRWGAKHCRTEAIIDGHSIVREQGSKGNRYLLDGQPLQFGTGEARTVPAAVAQLLNLSEESFAGQHAPHYWVFLSAGEVSRELNGVVNLGLIDQTLSGIASEVRAARAEVTVAEKRLAEALQHKFSLCWVPDALAKWGKIVKLSEVAQQKRLESHAIASRLQDRVNAQRTSQNATYAILACSSVVSSLGKALDLRKQVDRLRSTLAETVKLRNTAQRIIAPHELARLGAAVERADTLRREMNGLRTALTRRHEAAETVVRLRQEADRANEELARAMQGKCPACGRG